MENQPAAFASLGLAKLQLGAEAIDPTRTHREPRSQVLFLMGKIAFMTGDARPSSSHCHDCAYASLGWKQEEHDYVTAVSALCMARGRGL
jgi:hypothetical protein